ncbi:hypothetical protein V6N13_147930 [Hibiscus sabdariffa]
MEFQHFLHPHKLRSMEFEDNQVICFGCLDFIVGPAYYCTECRKFVMHKSCGAFPPQVQKDSFHPHPLIFNTWDVFVCDACKRLTASFISYRCMHCEFKLHLKCAMAIFNDEHEIGKRDEEDHQRITIRHFCHPHQLTRCTLSLTTHMEKELWRALKSKCVACNLDIQGTPLLIYVYVCFYCLFIIHESCISEMPRQVQRSPFHPRHVLLPRPFLQDTDASRQVRCYACRETIEGCSFYCNKCDVNLHVSCAKYQTRAIKHTCHPHNLQQLGKRIIHNISCDACGEDCEGSCFSCKKCDFYIHPQCIPLPSSFIHKHHLHPLALVSPFVEDDSGDYYCDMCETERNPDLQVYYCEECNFIAHIDCVIYEVLEPTIEMRIDPEENSGDENWESEERGHNKMVAPSGQAPALSLKPPSTQTNKEMESCKDELLFVDMEQVCLMPPPNSAGAKPVARLVPITFVAASMVTAAPQMIIVHRLKVVKVTVGPVEAAAAVVKVPPTLEQRTISTTLHKMDGT